MECREDGTGDKVRRGGMRLGEVREGGLVLCAESASSYHALTAVPLIPGAQVSVLRLVNATMTQYTQLFKRERLCVICIATCTWRQHFAIS